MTEPNEATNPEQLAPYLIELARSNRSTCKGCKKKIEKDMPRIGFLLEGPYGTGYLWHHLECLAKKDFAKVEEAYAGDYTKPGVELPPLETLRKEAEKAAEKKAEKQLAPFVERASTGRSKCTQCGELIDAGAFRFGVLRAVEFYGQERKATVKVHPACVEAALQDETNASDPETFAVDVRRNSKLEPSEIEEALSEAGVS